MTAYKLKRMFISVLYPNRCPFCDKEIEWDKYFCDSCCTKLNFIDTAKTDTDMGEIIAVCAYDDAAKTIVYPMKDDNSGYACGRLHDLSATGWRQLARALTL